MNSQARELELGSGGFDVLYANLTRGLGLPAGRGRARDQAAVLARAVRSGARRRRATSWQPSWPACPSCAARCTASWPRSARASKGGGWPTSSWKGVRCRSRSPTRFARCGRGAWSSTASQGACFGGEVECVNVASALAWAAAAGHDAVVCAVGPGIVGTSSRLGHGGVAAAAAANFAAALGGSPVLAVRVSSADERERHRGVSHHTRAVIELCLGDVKVAWPRGSKRPSGSSHAKKWTSRAGRQRAAVCLSHIWSEARTRSPGSSRPRSRRAAWHAGWCADRGTAPGSRRRSRHLEHVRWRRRAGEAGRPARVRGRSQARRLLADVRRGGAFACRRARRPARAVDRGDEDLVALRRRGACALRQAARLVWASGRGTGAQPRFVGGALAVARGRTRRGPDRPRRSDALRPRRLRRARAGAEDRSASRRCRCR